jgi:hypothetical protein
MTMADQPNAEEQDEIKAMEQREAQAVLAADVSTLEALWADDLIVNSTANLIAGKETLLKMIQNKQLRLRAYERRPVRIAKFGDLVVTTGNETSDLIGSFAEYKLFSSYMNMWAKRNGSWQLLARHVGLIARGKPESLR